MQLTPEQVKGRIKSLAKVKNADARVLMRIYMMERFLHRKNIQTPVKKDETVKIYVDLSKPEKYLISYKEKINVE